MAILSLSKSSADLKIGNSKNQPKSGSLKEPKGKKKYPLILVFKLNGKLRCVEFFWN